MKNPEEFIKKMNQELKDTPPPKGSNQEYFMRGLINAAEEKSLKSEKEDTVKYSENPKDMEELFEGVLPEKYIKINNEYELENFDADKAADRLFEIEKILNEQEGLMASDPEDRKKMIGYFEKNKLKKEAEELNNKINRLASLLEEKDYLNENDERSDVDKFIPPVPLRKRGRPKKVIQVEDVVREWDREDLKDNSSYIENSKKRAKEIKELKEKENLDNKRVEMAVTSKIEEIKNVIDKEFKGEPETPKTLEERLESKKKELEELKRTLKDLNDEISVREAEYKELFLSEQVMRNLVNKWWFESDTEERLKVEIASIKKEVLVAKEVEKELKLEIKRINKDIQERDFQEGRKKLKEKEILNKELEENVAKKELKKLQYESKKDDLVKIEKELLKIDKDNSFKSSKNKDELLAEKDELETEIMTYELENSNSHELLERKEDEILEELKVLKINAGKVKSGEMNKDEYDRKIKVLEDRLRIVGKIKEEIYRKAGVL